MDTVSLEQKALLALLGQNLFSVPFVPDPDVNWEAVVREARVQTVFSVAFDQYSSLPLGEELASNVQKMLMNHALTNASCYRQHHYLHELMRKNNISYCVLKGVASAACYPDPILRAMGDVDFYVHQDDLEKVDAILVADGFECVERAHSYHCVYKKGRVHFEVHFKPIGYKAGPLGDIYEEYWSDICETAVLNKSELVTYYGPSLFHHGFILLTHLQQHLFCEGIGLRHLCDWVLFVNSLSDEEFSEIFESRLKRIGLYRMAQLLSLIAVKHMGAAYKNWMGDDYDTADEILLDILHGGNFGRKDRQRAYEGIFIVSRGVGDKKSGWFIQLFKFLNEITTRRWKIVKKIPILYPVGWAYFFFRYLFRVLIGKRKMNLFSTLRKGTQRRGKFNKINVFEPEEETKNE